MFLIYFTKVRYITKLSLLSISLLLSSVAFSRSGFAAGGVNVDLTSCDTGQDNLGVSYEMVVVPGNYANIQVQETIIQNGEEIYDFDDAWGGSVICGDTTCTCDWGTPCPITQDFTDTATEEDATITAIVQMTWEFTDNNGVTVTEQYTGSAVCTTPVNPDECSNPIPYSQPPVLEDCGGECASDSYCVIGAPDWEPRCVPASVCQGAPGQCSAPIPYTQPPTADNCGTGGCGSSDYCVIGPPGWTPTCLPAGVCNGGQCAVIGQVCNVMTRPCCDTSQSCDFIPYAGTRVCTAGNSCEPGQHAQCDSTCPLGGRCEIRDINNPDAGGTCVCTDGATLPPGSLINITDEAAVPPIYAGAIIDYESFLQNVYRLMIPITIGFGGIPILILGGYRILSSQGDPKAVKEGKEDMTAAVTGILYILLALSILRIILRNFLGGL